MRDYEERVRFQFGDRDVEQLLADEPYYPGGDQTTGTHDDKKTEK